MIRKSIISLAIVCFLTGCLGHNALVARAMRFNLTAAEGRWTREALFVGMWIIPVYPVFMLVDLLVLNSMEFWSGSNPINGKSPLLEVPRSELEKYGIERIQIAQIERLTETRALLYVEFENGDRVTFDVTRERDSYTVSYSGIEFFKGKLEL